ncbi:MAG TPA: ABC transporter permease [Mycobacteriales bacterium]|nr:ABC transporter permease [Mycobacteriales bacterium]
MSTGLIDQEIVPQAPRRRRRRMTLPVVLLGIAGLLMLVSAVRLLTGANDITSSGTIGAALRLAVPIGLAGLGGLWSERAGVVNIGLEGQLILGTWFGAWGAYEFGAWWGVLAGILGGALGGLIHALATVTFGVDHIVSGVALNILGAGLTRFLSALIFVDTPGGGVTQSPSLPPIDTVTLPGSAALRELEAKGWFLISDLAGLIGGLITQVSLLTLVAIALVPISYVLLWRTKFGLRLRSCGEAPSAAESLGVNVYKMKYLAVIVSGGFAGLGGAFLAEVATSIYREGQTNGRGYIGLAAMIFGNWRPGGLAMGAGIFGYTDSLQLRSGGESVHALLLLLAVVLAGFAVWSLVRGRRLTGVITLVLAALVLLWFLATDTVPDEFVGFAPHLTTLLVLSLAAQRLRPPAADGRPYRRGEAR